MWSRILLDEPSRCAAVLDLDGTLWHDNEPIPGASEFMQSLISQSVPFVLLSNTGERTCVDVVAKFARVLQLHIEPTHVHTALDNMSETIDHLWQTGDVNEITVIAPARNQAWKDLPMSKFATSFCAKRRLPPNPKRVIAVLSDGKFDEDYHTLLTSVCDEIHRGSRLFVTSDDDTLIEWRHGVMSRKPGPGMFVRNLLTLIGPEMERQIKVFGKGKDSSMPKAALRKLKDQGFIGTHRSVYFIGDRLDADIRAAFQVGCIAVHVESGCHTSSAYDDFPEDVPHVAASSVFEVSQMFQALSFSNRLHDSVRDNIVTTTQLIRSGAYGNLAKLTVRQFDRVIRVPPRRIRSVPNLTELALGCERSIPRSASASILSRA